MLSSVSHGQKYCLSGIIMAGIRADTEACNPLLVFPAATDHKEEEEKKHPQYCY